MCDLCFIYRVFFFLQERRIINPKKEDGQTVQVHLHLVLPKANSSVLPSKGSVGSLYMIKKNFHYLSRTIKNVFISLNSIIIMYFDDRVVNTVFYNTRLNLLYSISVHQQTNLLQSITHKKYVLPLYGDITSLKSFQHDGSVIELLFTK